MRIVCQKCSAAYAIDDKFVTPKGVRAQCPRCRHLQLVKREGADAPAPPPANSPFLFDMAGQPNRAAAPAVSSYDLSEAPTGRVLASAPPPVPPVRASGPPAPAPFAFDFSVPPPSVSPLALPSIAAPPPMPPMQPSPFDFGSLPSMPSPAPQSSAMAFEMDLPPPPAPPMPSPSALVKLSGPPSTDSDSLFDFGSRAGVGAASEVNCKSCGKALTDPFDQALGTCDDCRSKQQERPDELGAEPNNRVEHIDTSMLAARMAPAKAQFIPVTTTTMPVASTTEVSVVRSAMRGHEARSNRARNAGIALGVLAMIGIAALLITKKPWERKRPPPVIRQAPTSAKPVDAVVQSWRMNYPELDGASPKQAFGFVGAGEEALSLDTTKGYIDAEEAFKKALVIDNANERAIAGWVFALAFGRGSSIDDQTATAAESMLAAAEQRSGEPRLYLAHSHLLIARNGNANDIQVMAERGKNSTSSADKALASMAIGQAMLSKNETVAGEAFAEALRLDPKLKRGYFFQARLAASMGRYRDAAMNLEKRLELDADQWEAAEELARIDVEVGELTKAKKVLEVALKAAPKNAKPRIALAKLAYQHAGDPAGAVDLLNAVVTDKEVANKDLSDAYMHLSAAYRAAGEPVKSAEAAEKALELSPDSVPAKLQRFIVMVDKNVTSQARLDLDSIKGKLGDANLDQVLEGRLLFAQGRFEEAAAILGKVQEVDPRRAEALLLAGAASARAKQDGRAWEYCLKRGSKLDPLSFAVPAMTQLYVRPADILRPGLGAYASLNPSGVEDPNPELCEGLMAWFSEDNVNADKHFARVITIDQKNADAYAYRALISLRRKDVGGALRLGGKAVDAVRLNALAHYSLAAALMANNKPDAAKPEAVTANKLGAQLLAPRVIMGDAEARVKNDAEARRLLTTVLLSDSYYREAKRVLYKQSL